MQIILHDSHRLISLFITDLINLFISTLTGTYSQPSWPPSDVFAYCILTKYIKVVTHLYRAFKRDLKDLLKSCMTTILLSFNFYPFASFY